MPVWNSEYTWQEISNYLSHIVWDIIWSGKGSLAVGTAAATPSNVNVGADGEVLVADSAVAEGVKWRVAPNCSLPFTKGATSVSAYIAEANTYTSAVYGFVATRAGSIVGLSACLNVSAESAAGDVAVEARINDNPVFSVTITTAGVAVYTAYATQARGLSPFVAGDLIQVYINFMSFTGTVNPVLAMLDLLFVAP